MNEANEEICTQEIKQVDQNAQNPQIEDSVKGHTSSGDKMEKDETIRTPLSRCSTHAV